MLDISVKQMKYAVEIAHCGSINQAAQTLYVTQSSLSKAMKELENVLGYAVFQRGPAGTAVTEEGREFLQTAEKIVYQLELLERQTFWDHPLSRYFGEEHDPNAPAEETSFSTDLDV